MMTNRNQSPPAILLGSLVFLAVGGMAYLASGQSADEQTLINYDSIYAHGGVGFFGDHLTSAEKALREIYKRRDAARVLETLYPRCHSVGKAYVLSALWHLDTNRFHVLAEDFVKEPGQISTETGDIGLAESKEELTRDMHYQSSTWSFHPIKLSEAAMKEDKARRFRDTEELLSHDPNWSGIKSAFTVKEIWDVDDSAVITLATNVPSKREIRLKISAPWQNGQITIQHSLPRLLAVTTDLSESYVLHNVPKSKRITIWGKAGQFFEERDISDGLRKAIVLQTNKSEWMEVVITDWDPKEGWDLSYLKLFHPLGTDVWLNQGGSVWDHKVK